MNEIKDVKLKFAGNGSITLSELSIFLYEFRRLYSRAYFVDQFETKDRVVHSHRYDDTWDLRQELLSNPEIVRMAQEVLAVEYNGIQVPSVDVIIKSFTINSPIEIVMCCSLAVLTIAVVFSGGKIKTELFEAELPPLAEGIIKIREALSTRDRTEELLLALEILVDEEKVETKSNLYTERMNSLSKELRIKNQI